ncbi:MAG: hypothetical protein AAFX54_17925 [Pseudomonadota bacterium]
MKHLVRAWFCLLFLLAGCTDAVAGDRINAADEIQHIVKAKDFEAKLARKINFANQMDVHSPARLSGMIFTLDENGELATRLPAFTATYEIVSGTKDKFGKEDSRNPVLYSGFVSKEAGVEANFNIFGSLAVERNHLFQVQYRHLYNVEAPDPRSSVMIDKLLAWVNQMEDLGELESGQKFYFAEVIGVYGYAVTRYYKQGNKVKISGLAFGSGGAWYNNEGEEAKRRYEISPQALELSKNALLAAKAAVEAGEGGKSKVDEIFDAAKTAAAAALN